MKFLLTISLLTTFLFVKSQNQNKLDLVDSLLNIKQYSQAIIISKDISDLDNVYDKMKLNGLLTTAYLGLDQTRKAIHHANKIYRTPNFIAGYARTRKTSVCSELANYYLKKENWKHALKWKKKRLYKYNLEVCGNGKHYRNSIIYKDIIEICKNLENSRLVTKYENKLSKYNADKSDLAKIY